MSRPSKLIVPASGWIMPAIVLSRVDLPAPFDPMTVTKSPAASVRLMSRSATASLGVPA